MANRQCAKWFWGRRNDDFKTDLILYQEISHSLGTPEDNDIFKQKSHLEMSELHFTGAARVGAANSQRKNLPLGKVIRK